MDEHYTLEEWPHVEGRGRITRELNNDGGRSLLWRRTILDGRGYRIEGVHFSIEGGPEDPDSLI